MEESVLPVGRLLCGKWRLLRTVGAGGMATVYAASHRNGKTVALKVLHPRFRTNAQVRARFLREAYIANLVGHPNVPSVLDDAETDERDAFLIMDLLHGESLEIRRLSSQISTCEVLRIAGGVLDVLAAAHSKGIVHRDIKPGNVFLADDGAVHVLDFGIASIRDTLSARDVSTLTQPGGSPGTPAFMAPEQARGRSELVDARTDIWAVGALLFTLLTRRTVHEALTSNELMIAAATTPAPPIGTLRPDLADDVARLVDRALSLHPEFRWSDARSMQEAISRLSVAPNRVLSVATSLDTIPEGSTRSIASEPLIASVANGVRRPKRLYVWAAAVLACAAGWTSSPFQRGVKVDPPRAQATSTAQASVHEKQVSAAPTFTALSSSAPKSEVESMPTRVGAAPTRRSAARASSAPRLPASATDSKQASPVAPQVSSASAPRSTDPDWLDRRK